MKILIIDDEEDIRRIATLSLTHVGGHEVTAVASAAEGIVAARALQPEVILLDVMMPGMDGTAALGVLRADPRTLAIPVVFITARAMATEIERLRALGARGVVTKPFNGMKLSEELQRILAERTQ